jgi:cation diffusion facilitator family transporter
LADTSRQAQVRRALILTLIANLLVAIAKATIGLITGSLAMVGDGIHSSLDATSNVIGLISTAIAARPPDEDHPYGHRRFETLASLLIGGMLLLSAWEIAKGAVNRLTTGETPEVTALSFVVMIGTLAVNLGVSIYESRIGKRLNSEILQADAQHTRSDVWVSLTVLGSLAAVALGAGWVDAAAALLVVILIVRAAWGIIRRSVDVLVDAAALEAASVSRVAEDVPGIERVTQVRSRGPSDSIQLDLDVQVAAPTTADRSEAIAGEVEDRLRNTFEGVSEVRVHFIPRRDGPLDYALLARAEADALGLGVHEVIPTTGPEGLMLDLHVEAPPELTVGAAHDLVSQFETRMRERLPDLARIVTHIEPAHPHEEVAAHDEYMRRLGYKALELAANEQPDLNWHDADIRREPDGGYALSVHCNLPDDMPLEDAHRLAERVETRLRAELPALHRVTIHTEPPGNDN